MSSRGGGKKGIWRTDTDLVCTDLAHVFAVI
jgi:hypothetical protein